MMNRRSVFGAALASSMVLGHATVSAQKGPIRIGEINSYKAQPAFLEPYRKGMELAVAQINAAGVYIFVKDENFQRGACPGGGNSGGPGGMCGGSCSAGTDCHCGDVCRPINSICP